MPTLSLAFDRQRTRKQRRPFGVPDEIARVRAAVRNDVQERKRDRMRVWTKWTAALMVAPAMLSGCIIRTNPGYYSTGPVVASPVVAGGMNFASAPQILAVLHI